MDSLNQLRAQLDQVDTEILALLAQRFAITQKVGEFKAEHNLSAYDAEREKEIFQRLAKNAEDLGLDKGLIIDLYTKIIAKAKSNHEKIRLN